LPSDLLALTGNSAALLSAIVAALAYGWLHDRRGLVVTIGAESVKEAKEQLEALRGGEMIFSFVETETSGMAFSRERTRQEFRNEDLLTRSLSARRFMGRVWQGRWGCGGGYGGGWG
jgi:hypothetical protein